jgi:hypothetical protein
VSPPPFGAPPATAPAAPSATAGNPNPFGTKSLDYVGGTDSNDANYRKLTDRLQEADTERRKAQEAAEARERAAEIRREERARKIKYMQEMPDSQPAGTGKSRSLQENTKKEAITSWVHRENVVPRSNGLAFCDRMLMCARKIPVANTSLLLD